jgi:hypothetical protein
MASRSEKFWLLLPSINFTSIDLSCERFNDTVLTRYSQPDKDPSPRLMRQCVYYGE